MRSSLAGLLAVLVLGCDEGTDLDGDGVGAGRDCDDRDPAVYPGADELCDTIDNDCDGLVDDEDELPEDLARVQYLDEDGDGYGVESDVVVSCAKAEGRSPVPGDCDDSDPTVSPEGYEDCDGIDNDCDGLLDAQDDDFNATDMILWYTDEDGDGYGDSVDPVGSCSPVDGRVTDDRDCDDGDPGVHPHALETCGGADLDCDGDPMTVGFGTANTDPISIGDVAYAGLQEAVDAAASGDTVDICPGTHTVALGLQVDTSVTLNGPAGAEQTTLTALSLAPVITVSGGADLTVSGLSILSGEAEVLGGGIDASAGAGALVVSGCIFEDNEAPFGSAIAAVDTTVTIESSTFTGNTSEDDGTSTDVVEGYGAVYLLGATARISGSAFDSNTSYYGGALAAFSSDITIDEETRFSGNAADSFEKNSTIYGGFGGAIFLDASTVRMSPGTRIENNTAILGGGMSMWSSDVSGGLFTGNFADYYGGGVCVYGKGGRLDGATVQSNEAEYGGGGIAFYYDDGSTVQNTLIDLNTTRWGGGLYLLGANSTLADSVVSNNDSTSYDYGNGMHLNGAAVEVLRTVWENGTDDVSIKTSSSNVTYDYSGEQSFSCSGYACN